MTMYKMIRDNCAMCNTVMCAIRCVQYNRMCNTVLCAICYVQYANEAVGRPICMQMERPQIFKILQYFNKTVHSVQFWKKDFVISIFLKFSN